MKFSPDIVDEIEMLSRFKLSTMQEGLKVHHTADESVIAATERLFQKGLITQKDGGYLTHLGIETAEHIEKLYLVLHTEGEG